MSTGTPKNETTGMGRDGYRGEGMESLEGFSGGRRRAVVVGAGFGGLWATRSLARYPLDVYLLDRNNYHTFLPLLYQVAAAELEPEEITCPVRSLIRSDKNVRFVMAEVTGVDFESRMVVAGMRKFPYDYLVLAAGSFSHYFGVPGAKEYSYSLKTLEDGISIRNNILGCFECASGMSDPLERKKVLTFSIIGGGATGVEFAGALIELIKGPLVKDYPEIDIREVAVILLEGSDRLLPGMPDSLSRYALNRLRKLGVTLRLGAVVEEISPGSIILRGGERIPTDTVIWTAGVSGAPFLDRFGIVTDRRGRAPVEQTLQLPYHPEVYVIGDLAAVSGEKEPHPMLAPVAVQQGMAAARNIGLQLAGEKPVPFRYRDRGTMVVIGRNAAVAHIGARAFTGFFAWVLWLVVHLIKLVGFRNRLLVMINWAWDYFFFERAVRIILPLSRKP